MKKETEQNEPYILAYIKWIFSIFLLLFFWQKYFWRLLSKSLLLIWVKRQIQTRNNFLFRYLVVAFSGKKQLFMSEFRIELLFYFVGYYRNENIYFIWWCVMDPYHNISYFISSLWFSRGCLIEFSLFERTMKVMRHSIRFRSINTKNFIGGFKLDLSIVS